MLNILSMHSLLKVCYELHRLDKREAAGEIFKLKHDYLIPNGIEDQSINLFLPSKVNVDQDLVDKINLAVRTLAPCEIIVRLSVADTRPQCYSSIARHGENTGGYTLESVLAVYDPIASDSSC